MCEYLCGVLNQSLFDIHLWVVELARAVVLLTVGETATLVSIVTAVVHTATISEFLRIASPATTGSLTIRPCCLNFQLWMRHARHTR